MLQGKVALITGSTRGIGWSTARLFAQHGASLVVNGRSADAVQQRAAELRQEFGTQALGFVSDVADAASVKSCYQAIFKEFKRLDVLVNNAGILHSGLLGMIPEDAVGRVMEINTFGSIRHMQEATRLMARNRSGSIVNLTSIIAINGNQGNSIYSASKAAIIGLTRSAAKELALKNIRVNAVAPGLIKTDMIKDLRPEELEARVSSIKMGRIGEPEDVANVILFLASDLSSYVTGQVIGVDGGMLI